MLDSFELPECDGRRVLSLSSCTLDWVGTQLTFIACVVRGVTKIPVLVFRHNDNKIKHMYSVTGLCQNIENEFAPESIPKQSYKEFPMEVSFSPECSFLTVTMYTGEIKVCKMPPILNPLKDTDQSAPPTGIDAAKDPKAQAAPAKVNSREGNRESNINSN
jgi:hypothetical protein